MASAQALKIRAEGPSSRARLPPLHPSPRCPGPASRLSAALQPSPPPRDRVKGPRGRLSRPCPTELEPWPCSNLLAVGGRGAPGCAPCSDAPLLLPPGRARTVRAWVTALLVRGPTILLLKGMSFTLAPADPRRSPDVLKDFAPGSKLPILLYDGGAKTDTLQIEEFLEETLGPPSDGRIPQPSAQIQGVHRGGQ